LFFFSLPLQHRLDNLPLCLAQMAEVGQVRVGKRGPARPLAVMSACVVRLLITTPCQVLRLLLLLLLCVCVLLRVPLLMWISTLRRWRLR
jgi:hypothetical protein